MSLARTLVNYYADCRGYGRSAIWGQVAGNVSLPPRDVTDLSRRLFQQRFLDAVARFPAYAEKIREHLGRIPLPGEVMAPADLPVWTKADQNALFESLKAPPLAGAFLHATGGSTGVPTRFYMTRESYEWRTAAADRGYSWAKAGEGVRSFYIWSTPVHPPAGIPALKQKLHRRFLNRRYFSLFHFNSVRKQQCCQEINAFRPISLVSYSGNLLELAHFVRDNPGLLAWYPETIVGAAEGLPPGGREIVETHLGGEVFMSYGSREFMLIGMECSRHEGYHITSDVLYVEVADDAGRPLAPGQIGRILVTDLRNPATPFIRYDIGDMGAMAADEPCECGCPFPRLARVEGRCGEFVELPDGSRLTAIFIAHTLKEFQWINGFQIVQSDKDGMVVRLITRDPFSPPEVTAVERLLREKTGPAMQISFERVEELEKSPSGKTPPVLRVRAG